MKENVIGNTNFVMPSQRWIGKKENFRQNSQVYAFTTTSITDGSSYVVNLDQGAYQKYLPYNFLQITNNLGGNVKLVFPESGNEIIIFDGTSRSFDEESIPAFRYVNVKNDSGGDLTGQLEVLVQKVESYREVIKERLLR